MRTHRWVKWAQHVISRDNGGCGVHEYTLFRGQLLPRPTTAAQCCLDLKLFSNIHRTVSFTEKIPDFQCWWLPGPQPKTHLYTSRPLMLRETRYTRCKYLVWEIQSTNKEKNNTIENKEIDLLQIGRAQEMEGGGKGVRKWITMCCIQELTPCDECHPHTVDIP